MKQKETNRKKGSANVEHTLYFLTVSLFLFQTHHLLFIHVALRLLLLLRGKQAKKKDGMSNEIGNHASVTVRIK